MRTQHKTNIVQQLSYLTKQDNCSIPGEHAEPMSKNWKCLNLKHDSVSKFELKQYYNELFCKRQLTLEHLYETYNDLTHQPRVLAMYQRHVRWLRFQRDNFASTSKIYATKLSCQNLSHIT